jgi:hypothetical protein
MQVSLGSRGREEERGEVHVQAGDQQGGEATQGVVTGMCTQLGAGGWEAGRRGGWWSQTW